VSTRRRPTPIHARTGRKNAGNCDGRQQGIFHRPIIQNDFTATVEIDRGHSTRDSQISKCASGQYFIQPFRTPANPSKDGFSSGKRPYKRVWSTLQKYFDFVRSISGCIHDGYNPVKLVPATAWILEAFFSKRRNTPCGNFLWPHHRQRECDFHIELLYRTDKPIT